MLFVLGWWLGVKHEDLSRLVVFTVWVLALASFGAGIWQYLALARVAALPEDQSALIAGQRKLIGLLLSAGGLVLASLGLYVGFTFGLTAFGEAVGMVLLGLIALFNGFKLLQGEKAPTVHPFFDLLRRQHGPFGLVLMIAGLALAATAAVLVLYQKMGQEWFPETASLMLLGILGLAGGVWLLLSQTSELTTARMRIFVLVVGGVAGLILSLGALGRAFAWRDDIFGGMRAWQGDQAWHLWLCAYVELIGMGLMFLSLLLARTDIRASAVLRRVLFGYNAVLTGLLLLAMLAVLNIVLFALLPFSFEWSKSRGAHTLSPSTKIFLGNLSQPTTFYVLLPRQMISTELKNFLENCQNQSTKLEVKYLSPHKDFEEYENLVKRFPDSLTGRMVQGRAVDRGILIVYGALPADPTIKVPHAMVSADRLEDRKPIQSREENKVVALFKGESEVMNELSSLAQDRKKRKVYVLQGNGEPDLNIKDPGRQRDVGADLKAIGYGFMAERLRKDQFDVEGLSFGTELPKDKTEKLVYAKEIDNRKEVPDDAEAILVAQPGVSLSPSILDALERYMDRGGSLVILFDSIVDTKAASLKTTGLEEFVRKYGVLVGKEFALRVPRTAGVRDDARMVFATVPSDTSNDLGKLFITEEPLAMDNVRIVKPDPAAQKYKVEVLLYLDPRDQRLQQIYWEETDVKGLTNHQTFFRDLAVGGTLRARISTEPLPVAVAVSEKQFDPGTGKERLKPRMIVIGDAEFMSNLDVVSALQQGGSDLAFAWTTSMLNWLSAKKTGLSGARPKESSSYSINPLQVDVDRMRLLPGWLMMVGIVGLGGGIWVVRRR